MDFPSLNGCLSPGPKTSPETLMLFLQFCLNKVVIKIHILQIALAPEEKNAIRFCSFTEDLKPEPEVLKMKHIIFGSR